MYLGHTDDQLLALLYEGDRNAFEAIYYRYAPGLLAFTKKTIYDAEECNEIVQDIFESLWSRHAELEIGSLESYLFSAARYLMIKYFRRSRLTREYAEHFTFFESAYDTMGEDERDQEMLRARMMKAIEGLAGHCRTALKLRLHENLSNGEIAIRMNITKETVEHYMVKAIRTLRTKLTIENSR